MPPEIKIICDMKETIYFYGRKLHKHEIKECKMNKKYSIFKQRCKCPSCGKTITTPLDCLLEKYCNYVSEIGDLVLSIGSIEHSSYRNKSKLFNKEMLKYAVG